jgi:iron complex outermembrane receptor protein
MKMKKRLNYFLISVSILQLSCLAVSAENTPAAAGNTFAATGGQVVSASSAVVLPETPAAPSGNTALAVKNEPIPSGQANRDAEKNASPAASKAQYELEDVVITGTKTKLKVIDSPAAVSVVTQKDIEKKSVVYSDDLVTGLPGVQVARTEKGDQSTVVTMRGVPGYDKNLILLDGRSIQNPFNGRVFWNRVPVDLVERVEVVKGAFSSLYGQYALGGVINIITKEPEGRSFNLKSAYDSTNIRTTAASYLDKPLEQLAYYFSFENQDVNGPTYYQYVQKSANKGTAATKVTGYQLTTDSQGNQQYIIGEMPQPKLQNNNYSGKVYYFPAPGQTISFLGNYSYWDQPTSDGVLGKSYLKNAATGQTVSSGTVELAGTGKTISVSDKDFLRAPGQNIMYIYILDYKGKVNDIVSLAASGSYAIGTELNSVGALDNNSTAFSGSDGNNGGEGHQLEKSLTLQSDLALGVHHLIVGAAYDNCLNRNVVTTHPFWRDLSYTELYDSYKSEGNIYSGYLQDEWKLFQELTAFLGVRYDHWSRKDGTVYSTLLSQYLYYPESKADVFSPKVSLVYRPLEALSVRASVGTAFNPPTNAELYSYSLSSTNQTIANPNLVPEKDTSWEAGGEYTFGTRTTVSGTYFENYLKDLIYSNVTFGLNNFTTTQYVNAGQATIKGVELEVKQPIFSFLDASANYTYVNGIIVENSADKTSVGKFIPNIAQHAGSVTVSYHTGNFSVDFIENGQSKIYRTSNNSDTVNGVQGSYDPFATSDLKFGYALGSAKFSFGIENLGGQQYYTIYKTPGRTYNASLSYSFF